MIYVENCLDTMSRMKDGSVDMTVTSPPYDNLRNYSKQAEFDFKPIASELFRITKDGGVLVWVVNDQTKDYSETSTSFRQALHFMEIGFKLYDTMIWRKPNGMPAGKTRRYRSSFEYIFVLSKGKTAQWNPIMIPAKYAGKTKIYSKLSATGINEKKSASSSFRGSITTGKTRLHDNVFDYSVGFNNTACDKNVFKHPAPFPEALARDMISSWSKKGDLIYDPFGGSGTTMLMAHSIGRYSIISELNPEYAEIARQRCKPTMLFNFKDCEEPLLKIAEKMFDSYNLADFRKKMEIFKVEQRMLEDNFKREMDEEDFEAEIMNM